MVECQEIARLQQYDLIIHYSQVSIQSAKNYLIKMGLKLLHVRLYQVIQ